MTRTVRVNALIACIVLTILVGFGLMQILPYIIPISEHTTGSNLLFTILLIALGLIVPYIAIKLVFQAAHERNPEEKTMRLKDFPKDKDQIANRLRSR